MVRTLARPAEGTFATKLRTYIAPSVLVIDDVGLIPMARAGATAFFHVITTATTTRPHPRHDQPGPARMGEIFGDPVVAAAILDRLMHRAIVFNIKGPSWRMREHPALSDGPDDNDHRGKRHQR